ncbi:subtilisin-like protease SBT1.1 [Cocos nucifera]|nr:subtilisin-like protease SBT1.1 [Cocos nucifera]
MDATKAAAPGRSFGGTKGGPEAVLESLHQLSSSEQEREASAPPQLLYVYDTALSGFAAKLSPKQAKSLQQLDGFLFAYPDDMVIQLHTTYSPQFLGLMPGRGLWTSPNLASDVIIGVVDTGIWPEHVSFSDADISSRPTRWRGACEAGTKFSSKNCNNKLIGARAYWKGYEATAGPINETREFRSARDSQGHGTHTASTAGGDIVAGASLFGNAKGSAIGMRYTARIAAYKACWNSGCANSDILAAVDRAVADGVDVLSLSLGGGNQRPFYSDSIAIAAFGAIQKGVFVSCSAGNSGPYEATVSNTAPWIMTVAASYLGRSFPTEVKLGDGRTFKGASLYSGRPTELLPIVYDKTAGRQNARYCGPGSLSPKLVKGKIVLCERGIVSRTRKGEEVKLAGGAGMLLVDSREQGEELFADLHVLPASTLGAAAAKAIKSYITSSKRPMAMITFLGTAYGQPAPMMAAFSSRGPSLVGPDIIKPDVSAPGMGILAAWPPSASLSLVESDTRRANFNIISGTSMACPHVSGLGALLKAVHQDWSPAAIKSALMTTAYTLNNKNGSIVDVSSGRPATPFVFGSGHVNPERASNPGLVYDISPKDYLDYLCSLNYTSSQLATLAKKNYSCPSNRILGNIGDLNYPSFSVLFDSGSPNFTVTQTRIVTNVGQARCRYTVKVREPKGVTMNVDPKELAFVELGQKLSYKVSFLGLSGSDSSFGELVWKCGEFSVRCPVAVAWQ